MNILEEILEEIEKEQNSYEADHAWNYSKGMEYAKEIIRSHMDEESENNNELSNDDDYIMFTLNKDGVAEIYRDTYDIIIHCESIEEQKTVEKILKRCKGWIPVEERLPEEGTMVIGYDDGKMLIGRACIAMDGSIVVDDGAWETLWNVRAWMPVPEPYKPKKTIPAAGIDHIISRFTKVE